ncbi:MAG: hypothetical protein GT601_06050 [Acidaminobacter sp.]|uniref:phage holin family protein n=1 Tax=Acidaminobacter sp. TaxID=1872102 RepID=UPI00137D2720|nr:phage holin family protein [Acidaminobacter sp.]MZQ97218.1 hypothetical protein [Acidaminobacter sp.]
MNTEFINEFVTMIVSNPQMALFLSVFIVGWLLKEHSSLNNQLIPWALSIVGVVLGLLLIELSLSGGITGLIMAYIMMAFYDKIKGTIEVFFLKE